MTEKKYCEIKAKANDHAEVWIYDQIGEDWYSEGITAKRFCQDLAALKVSTIDLHINSPGGSVFDGQAIYNALVRHPATVTTYVDGLAASIASVIALAGDTVIMADNALFMIHNPWGFAQGTAEEMRKCADVLDKCRDTIVSVYAKKCDLTDAEIILAMDNETWFTAEEARKQGFCDDISAGQKLAALANFDFQALGFKRPPANTIPQSDPVVETTETITEPSADQPATTQAPAASNEEVVIMQNEQTTAPVNGAKEAADIVTMCVQNGCADQAATYISAGLSADQVGRKILEAKASAPIITPAAEASAIQRVQVRELYNPKSLKPFNRFGKEAERAAHEAGMWARATIFGDPKAMQHCKDLGLNMRPQAGLGETSGSAGAFLVPDSMESAIIDVRQEYGVARMLCDVRPMGTAGISAPVKISGTTAYFQGDLATMQESQSGWGQIEAVAKNLNALTKISNNLVEDAVIDIAADVARDHGMAFAAKEDACMVIGDGTSTYGGIVGLNTLFEAGYATLKGVYVAAATTDIFSEIVTGELAGVMGKLQRNWRRNANWLSSSVADDNIFTRLLMAAGGNTTLTLSGAIQQAFAGKPREINEYMADNPATDYSNKVILLYGDFSVACKIYDRRGVVIQVLREKYADENAIGVIGTERIDMNFDYAVGTASKPGPVIALVGGAS